MKKFLQILFIILGVLLTIAPAVTAVTHMAHIPPYAGAAIVTVVLFGLSALPKPKHAHGSVAGIQVEIWANYIINRLYKDNTFLKNAFSDDNKVVAGKIVHIPQPGARPTTQKNRTVFPATAVRRTDTDIVYVLNEFTTDPIHIENAETVELSYDKINSVLGELVGYLIEDVADNAILSWLDESVTSPTKIYTTGAATAATAPSATGNRLAAVTKDLKTGQLIMNSGNVPKADRFAMFESNMLDQLTDSLTATQYRDFSQFYDAATGTVGKLYGFNILDRSNVAVAASTNAIKAWGAAGAAGDSAVSLMWQKDSVARALGTVNPFYRENDPLYYGNVYSTLLRFGGRRRRVDDKGVIALIQAASA